MITSNDYGEKFLNAIPSHCKYRRKTHLGQGPSHRRHILTLAAAADDVINIANKTLNLFDRPQLISQISKVLMLSGVQYQGCAPSKLAATAQKSQIKKDWCSFYQYYSRLFDASAPILVNRMADYNGRKLRMIDQFCHSVPTIWLKIVKPYPNAKRFRVLDRLERLNRKIVAKQCCGSFDNLMFRHSIEWLIEQGYMGRTLVFTQPMQMGLNGIKRVTGNAAENSLNKSIYKISVTGNAGRQRHRISNKVSAISFYDRVQPVKIVTNKLRSAGYNKVCSAGTIDNPVYLYKIATLANSSFYVLPAHASISKAPNTPVVCAKLLLKHTQLRAWHWPQLDHNLYPDFIKKYTDIIEHASNIDSHRLPDKTREGSSQSQKNRKDKGDPSSHKCTKWYIIAPPHPGSYRLCCCEVDKSRQGIYPMQPVSAEVKLDYQNTPFKSKKQAKLLEALIIIGQQKRIL